MSGRLRSWGLVGMGLIAGISVSYGVTAYAFRDARSVLPIEELREFTDVFGAIKANYVEPVEDKKLLQEAITGMLAGLDPHSAFLDGEAYRDLQIGTQGEFGGLGIEVGSEDGAIKVIAPIDDTPAARAGIHAGDIIRVQSVKAHMIEPGYGFVRISQFQDRTTEDLVKQINELYKSGPLKGLVLDLRNDPGGVLNGAVGVAAVFLPTDTVVVTTEGRTDDAHRKYVAAPNDYLRGSNDDPLARLPAAVKTVPMVVLVNGASASASEIVAGALQDHKRAKLIGTQTFGKGSVQSVIQIRNDRESPAAIKLTTARYFTPSGRSIQAQGIVPDLLVEDTAEGNFAGLAVREADLTNHLVNTTTPAPEGDATAGDKDAVKAEAVHAPLNTRRYEFGAADDYQLHQALNFLKGQPVETAKAHDKVATAATAEPAKH